MKVTLKEKLGQEVENQIKTNEENSKE